MFKMIRLVFVFLLLLSLLGCSAVDMGPNDQNNRKLHPQLIAAGWGGSMVITEDGELWAWGHFHGGDEWCTWCGTGSAKYLAYPVKLTDNVASVSVGSRHVMVIKNDGSLWAWGDNRLGQLGDGTTINRPAKTDDGGRIFLF